MCPWQFINGEQEAAESAPDNMLGFLRNFYNQTEALSFLPENFIGYPLIQSLFSLS